MAKEFTTTYQWDDSRVIRRIDVRTDKRGNAVAYIYADNREEARQKRHDIRAALRLKGWGTLSDNRNGEFALRVSGMHHSNELLDMLREHEFVTGDPQISSDNTSIEKPKGILNYLRANSLQASGIFYSFGNLIYFINGIRRNQEAKAFGEPQKKGQISSALMWGAGDALIAVLGKEDDTRQLVSLLSKLEKHYQREGIEIPKTAAIRVETSKKDESAGAKIYDFLHEHVNQIKCATEVLAAVGYYNAGKEQGNVWKQRTAVTFGLGFLASLLIPERKIDEEKYAKAGPFSKLWMRIQSNPLTIGGVSGFSNTAFTTLGAMDERNRYLGKKPPKLDKNHQLIRASKHYGYDLMAPAIMFFGNSLYAISKKTTGGDIKANAVEQDVYTVASQILNKQPEALRENAMESTAAFLGERPEIKGSQKQILERLREEMTKQRQNPWFEKQGLAPYTPQPRRGVHIGREGHGVDAANDAALPANGDFPVPSVQGTSLAHEGVAKGAVKEAALVS